MYPNVFLRTFWRSEYKPQIFVAMSFAPIYDERFEKVFKPAIESLSVDGQPLKAYRVDISQSGDSIHTDILDGIAHSEMVLVDISTLGYDSKTGNSYRNGNVMYELGIAHACRQPNEVMVVRDDQDKFLFDVSTIPHRKIDFTDVDVAVNEIKIALENRIQERTYVEDARLKIAAASLTGGEVRILKIFANQGLSLKTRLVIAGQNSTFDEDLNIPRLLDRQFIKIVGHTQIGRPVYEWTRLGSAVAQVIRNSMQSYTVFFPSDKL